MGPGASRAMLHCTIGRGLLFLASAVPRGERRKRRLCKKRKVGFLKEVKEWWDDDAGVGGGTVGSSDRSSRPTSNISLGFASR